MPRYRIFRMKDTPRQNFRWAPHTSGETAAKPKDYEEVGAIEAPNAYSAWELLRASESPLEVGDIIESDSNELRICKYVGFEPARWVLPEIKTGFEGLPPAMGAPPAPEAAGMAS